MSRTGTGELKFQSCGTRRTSNGEKIIEVRLPKGCDGLGWLVERHVIIDGRDYMVTGVDPAETRSQFRRGDIVGLVVQAVGDGEGECTGWMIRGVDFL